METLIPIIRDVLVIGYLFVLRLGVPLLITLMFGSAMRKWLEESDARELQKANPPLTPEPTRSPS